MICMEMRCRLIRLSSLVIGGVLIASWGESAFAQLVPDTTLGSENSTFTPLTPAIDQIDGGATRDANLFHSFLEFNIGSGRSVYFTNPVGIENILTRVTGANPSNILGTLGITGGNANLFLINPNGIIFGLNARLDLGGSFVASTASSIKFADGTEFSAVNPSAPPLLTISVPIGLQFNGRQGDMVVQSSNQLPALEVQPGKSLALVGGNVTIKESNLQAPGGRVELGGVAGSGMVGLNVNGNELSLSFPDGVARADVSLTNQARVDASGEGGGFVQVQGDRITLTDASAIVADTEGNQNGKGILIQASQFSIQDGSQVSASATEESQGDSGGITVNASELVEVIGTRIIGQSGGTGDSDRPSRLASDAQGAGKAENLVINTGRLVVRNGGRISASTIDTTGGGSLIINASESVEVSGTSSQRQRPSSLTVQTRGVGQAGSLILNTGQLMVRDGAEVSASTFGTGGGGDIIINTFLSVEVSGTVITRDGELPSRIVADTGRPLDSQDVGTIVGTGKGGSLNITTGQLIIRDGAEVTVSSQGLGNAGSLTIGADSILLENQGSLRGETASGLGGNITLDVQDLILMRNGSAIATTAANNGSGGNITLNAPFIVAVPSENSDIVANADQGFGGRIDLTATGIYGLEFRDELTTESDINASSNVTGQDGIVEINTPEIDPSRGLTNLPTDLVDASNQIAQNCRTGGTQVARNEFIITGRGGLPDNPSEILSTDTVWTDLRSTARTTLFRPSSQGVSAIANSTRKPLLEAQGWVINEKGKVVLMAQAVPVVTQTPWQTTAECLVP